MHAAVHYADGKVIVTRQPDTTALTSDDAATLALNDRQHGVYLASPLADYVGGATIRVDGGTVRTV